MFIIFIRVVNVARSVKWVVAVRVVYVIAPYISSHHCQARYAEGGEIHVVAELPRSLVGLTERSILHRVSDRDRTTHGAKADPVQRLVAVYLLMDQGNGMGAGSEGAG